MFVCASHFPWVHPWYKVHQNSLQLCFSIREIVGAVDKIIMLGDFNLPSISWRSSNNEFLYPDYDHSIQHSGAVDLLDYYNSARLIQINSIANENNRLLDLCFVNDLDTG